MANNISISPKRIAFIIALSGTIWAFLVHTDNTRFLKNTTPNKVVHGMVVTADDASYLAPAENYINHGIWKDNSEGLSSYTQRTPGMGFLHAAFYGISPAHYPLWHKIFNLLIHFLNVYVFGLITLTLFHQRTAFFLQAFYAFIPCFWGYIFYYLTESITPALMVFLCYGYIKYQQWPSSRWIIFQAGISGIILLIRPQLIIFILPFIYFLFSFIRERQYKKWSVFALAILLCSGAFASWQIRSISLLKRWPGMHPIYDVTNNTQYRPVHRSLGELYKVWGHDGEKFHSQLRMIWDVSVADSSYLSTSVSDAVNSIPPKVFEYVQPGEFTDIYYRYYEVGKEIDYYSKNDLSVPGESGKERSLRLKIDSISDVLKGKMWLRYYWTTPLQSARFMFTKSQLNLATFQHKYRGMFWMEALRYACIILITLCTLLSIMQLLNTKNKTAFLLGLSTLIYLFYLFFIQKINEERYLVPLLPLFLAFGVYRITAFFKPR